MQPPSKKPLTISQLTQAIRETLEPPFRHLYLEGEVSNFKKQASGHLYFSLKDQDAQINAAMFRGDAATLRVLPKSGDQVLVRGELSVYPPRGNYQLIVRSLTPKGVGVLLQKLEELKRKIHKLGWFAKEMKKPLPELPQRIGIITSPTGAAIQDMLNVLNRRFANLHILLNPVRVQGEEAAFEIAQAIEQMNRYSLADVLILGRGGGSLEDLWPFNEEIVAKAIYKSSIPIICGVGHETDHTIAEYVADVRAPTPSAAAELVIAEKSEKLSSLSNLSRRLVQVFQSLISQRKHQLEAFFKQSILTSPYALLSIWIQKVDTERQELDHHILSRLKEERIRIDGLNKQLSALNPIQRLGQYKAQFALYKAALERSLKRNLGMAKERLAHLNTTLRAIDPKNLLKNGYSILFAEKDKSVISSIRNVNPGDPIRVLLSDGELEATVNNKKEPEL